MINKKGDKMNFNEIIRTLREDKDLNQTEVGKALKMTQRKISRMETGDAEPKIEDIKQLCIFYDVSADYILGFTNEKKPLPKQ